MAQVHLNEDEAIDAFLVRAIEAEDTNAVVLTSDDRQYASATALNAHPLGQLDASNMAAFVARRAALALERVVARYPAVERARSLSRWPAWSNWAIPLAALVLGVTTDVLGGGRRMHILAFPLLALILWNLAVFLVIAVRSGLRRPPTASSHPLLRSLEWVIRPASARLAGQPTLERSIIRYAREWSETAGPITRARASRTFHLSAALFAIGILGGMIARARYGANYSAFWGGTWTGAETEVALLLKTVLGPASLISGIPLPSAEQLSELRNSEENAGDWLKLWAWTAGLFVIVPRLILAALSGARAAFLARRFVIPDDFYRRSLVRNALGHASTVRVIPYGLELSDGSGAQVKDLMTSAMGHKTKVEVDQGIAYGTEDEWLAGEGDTLTRTDQLVLLFNLASTPEAENHGAFVNGVRQRLASAGTAILVLLDDSSFRRKFGKGASTERRVEERLEAWRAVILPSNLTPVTVSLDLPDQAPNAQILEQALARSGAPA